MSQNEKAVEYLERHIPEMAESAVKQAYWQALASGSSVLVSDGGFLKEIFPDGTVKNIRENKPFSKVQKGQVIKIK